MKIIYDDEPLHTWGRICWHCHQKKGKCRVCNATNEPVCNCEGGK